MTSFKKYFCYHFKSTLLSTAIISFISAVIAFISIDVIIKSNLPEDYPEELLRANIYSDIAPLGIILALLCIIIPILELYNFKNRKNLDTLLSLPISRIKLSVAHYLNGIIQIAISYTLCLLVAIIRFIPNAGYFSLVYFIPYYFASLFAGILMYSVVMFIFTQANTVLDGIIFIFAYMFGFHFIFEVLAELFSVFNRITSLFIMYMPIVNINGIFNNLIDGTSYSFELEYIFPYVFWGVLGIACTFGYVFTFNTQRAENAGSISDTWFGYKALLPIIVITLILFDIDFYIWAIIGMFIGYVVYRRSIKIKKPDIIALSATTILGAIVLFL